MILKLMAIKSHEMLLRMAFMVTSHEEFYLLSLKEILESELVKHPNEILHQWHIKTVLVDNIILGESQLPSNLALLLISLLT